MVYILKRPSGWNIRIETWNPLRIARSVVVCYRGPAHTYPLTFGNATFPTDAASIHTYTVKVIIDKVTFRNTPLTCDPVHT